MEREEAALTILAAAVVTIFCLFIAEGIVTDLNMQVRADMSRQISVKSIIP